MRKYIFLMFLLVSAAHSSDFKSSSADIFFGIYSNLFAPVKSHASTCQFVPSCSHYAAECVNEHGAFVGSVMASDRWMRCSGGNANKLKYPKLGKYFYDPPASNYFFAQGNLWSAGMNINSGSIMQHNDKANNFIHSLFREDDYESAILELKRKKYHSISKDTTGFIDMMIALCNLRLGKSQKALNSYQTSHVFESEVFKKTQFYFNFILHDQLELDNWNYNYLSNLNLNYINDTVSSSFLLYSMLKLEKDINFENFNYLHADSIMSFQNRLNDTPKSPALAGIMSAIIPGTGYFYCGEFKEGVSALFVNGLLGWGIYSLFKNDNTGSGILMSSVSAIFYLGNIAGSVNSAHVINDKYTQMQYLGIRKSLNIEFVFETSYLEDMIKLIK